MKLVFLLSVTISSLISVSSQSSSTVSFLGISPQDEDYFRKDTINCRNGSSKFTIAQLNDDYCDCPDGTDEPGTSACPEGKFYCQNVGHLPTTLYSSRVNDAICDCCDGSDEYGGKVKCRNTCWEEGKKARDKLQKLIDLHQEGVTIRRRVVELAKEAISKDRAELSKLNNEEKTLDKLVKLLKERKEQIEKAEEKEQLEKEKEDKNNTDVLGDDKWRDASDGNNKSGLVTSEDEIIGLVEQEDRSEHDDTDIAEEGSESTEGLSKEEIGRLVASRWTGENPGQVEETGTGSDNHGDGGEDESVNKARDDDIIKNTNEQHQSSADDNHAFSSVVHEPGLDEQGKFLGITTPRLQFWLEKMKGVTQNILRSVNWFSSPVDNLDASQILKKHNESATMLSNIQERISSLTEKLKQDFGPDDEFYEFYDQCFESKQDKYVYKVCPFKDVVQEEQQHQKTQLGSWEKFLDNYSTMLFSNGAGCWNGPHRSMKVRLRCGLKTEVSEVDEPSRCEYAAIMSTPVRCLDGKLKELKDDLKMLQKDSPQTRDEL
ncbi:Glucosidase 2 subunit beta [Linum perenne]